ncbi:MAG: polysaccharide biosynthesis C-terminal domain-containing protein [Chloroflexota bacterium]|nr:polysaccharide biosynthesis C-terminal domain-containing protein [Chloroflexota bacterium]
MSDEVPSRDSALDLRASARWLWRPAARRSLLRLSADVVGRALQLIILVAVARRLDSATFGTIVVGSTTGLLVGQAADLGLQLTVAADTARRLIRTSLSIGSALAVKVVLTLAAVPIFALLFVLLGADSAAAGAALVAAAFALDSFVQFCATTLRAANAFWHDWLVSVTPRLFAVFFVVPVALSLPEPRMIGFAWLTASVISAITAIVVLGSQLGIGAPQFAVAKDLLRRSWPIGASIVVGMAYTRMGLYMLEAFRSSQDVAIYGIAGRLTDPTYLIPAAGAAIFYPSYTRTLHERPNVAEKQLRRWILAITGIALATYLLLAVFGEFVARILFGDTFAASGLLLRVLALVIVPGFISYILNQALIARGQARYNLIVMATLLTLSVIGNLWAVPAFGIWGAAWVAVGIEILLLAALLQPILRRTQP